MLIARFDLRAPGADGPTRSKLHRSAVDMARFLDAEGAASIVVSEHHASDDGYLASPLTVATAMAAATERIAIVVAVTILPLQDPVRLAEDIIELDIMSGGRAMVVLGLGYRPEEYELFGVDFSRRGAIADRKLEALLELLGDAAAAEQPIRVTPGPLTAPVPPLAWGGGSVAAARRAGRFGLSFFAQTDGEHLRAAYRQAAADAGHRPGLCILPPPDAPYAVFVADDVDAGWDEVGEALLVDAAAYRAWNAERIDSTASFSAGLDLAGLRGERGAHRVVTPGEAAELIAEHRMLNIHPLCGGLDPDVAWPYLRRAVAAAT